MANTNLNIRLDSEIKKKAQQIFANLGLDTTTAINIFLRQVIRTNGLPFEVKADIPNEETLEAIDKIKELKNNPNKKVYYTFSELLEDVDKDV